MKATFDPDAGSAEEALQALRDGAISSRELTAHVLRSIEALDPKLNLFVTVAAERALAEAARADERRARGEVRGPLDGLPVSIKDVFATEGLRTTAGARMLERYTPAEDAVAVARLRAAGAVVVGKTNVPEFAADWQSFNDVAGTSRNPWDPSRTPGGSSGGAAAAVAAGLGFLGLGGDLNGSIRIPAHFCGVYGHRPTAELVPQRGHIPPPPGVTSGPSELPTPGPLARSAEDLRLALDVLAGPESLRPVPWTLPPPRQTQLRAYRLGYVIDDPFCPVDAPVREVLAGAIESLRRAGVQLSEGWPPGVALDGVFQNFVWLLAAFLSQAVPDEEFAGMQRAAADEPGNLWVDGTVAGHREWLRRSGQRLEARVVWQDYFRTHDAFLMPAAFVAAFPHDHGRDLQARRLKTSAGERRYDDLPKWGFLATLTGCPATVAPVGRTKEGLPVGLQILGPYHEDATPIDVASRMAEVTGGFVPPPHL